MQPVRTVGLISRSGIPRGEALVPGLLHWLDERGIQGAVRRRPRSTRSATMACRENGARGVPVHHRARRRRHAAQRGERDRRPAGSAVRGEPGQRFLHMRAAREAAAHQTRSGKGGAHDWKSWGIAAQ